MTRYYGRVHASKPVLVQQVIDMIKLDILPDRSPTDVSNTPGIQLLFQVLLHLKSFTSTIPAFISTSPDFQTELEFYQRLNRFVEFTQKIHSNPPVIQHLTLLTTVHQQIVYANPTDTSVTTTFMTLSHAMAEYLKDLYEIAIRVTETQRSLDTYFRFPDRFYMSPNDPDYTTDFLENDNFKNHQARLTMIQNALISNESTQRFRPEIARLILSTNIYDATFAFDTRYMAFVISNFLPTSAILDMRASSSYIKELSSSSTLDADSNLDYSIGNASFLSSTSIDAEYVSNPTDKKTPGTPLFPDEFYENKDGLPHTPKGRGKDKKDKPTPTHDTRHGDSSAGSPSPPSGRRTPPPTKRHSPVTPDDDDYSPDSLLAMKARTMTEKVNAQAKTDLSHDHMTRFNVNVEVASSIAKTQLRPDDYRIQVKDRNGTRLFLVTYTRKSRKPIFSPIS